MPLGNKTGLGIGALGLVSALMLAMSGPAVAQGTLRIAMTASAMRGE